MTLFEYSPPLSSELKRLGYNLPIEPSKQDIMLTKIILTSTYSDIDADVTLFQDYHFAKVTIPAIRVYAYYINNPQQFAHDPHNIIGSAIKQMLNACLSFLNNIYKHKPNHIIKARPNLIKNHAEQFLTIYYTTAKNLAQRVKHNTLLSRDTDLNINDRPNIDLFR